MFFAVETSISIEISLCTIELFVLFDDILFLLKVLLNVTFVCVCAMLLLQIAHNSFYHMQYNTETIEVREYICHE